MTSVKSAIGGIPALGGEFNLMNSKLSFNLKLVSPIHIYIFTFSQKSKSLFLKVLALEKL